ncbi:dihydrouridine synthase [Nemania sp. FL0916]|nr:dihydrouridine synthase [Nemania sp. FL0916]
MATTTATATATATETTTATAAAAMSIKPKLHGRAFYESLGSPKFVVAPMVDQSEFAWRMLTRSFLTPQENAKLLAYTPMFHARLFEENLKYRDTHFQATKQPTEPIDPIEPIQTTDKTKATEDLFLDGNPRLDRPLFVQFCANDPEHLLRAAQKVAPYCDAVDLNLGCPQGIARKGHYGAFLQEDQKLIYSLINNLHRHLSIPVTAKIRILETKEDTLAYAKNVLSAGASILTVHGRRREQKGHLTGVADWAYIRYLRDNLPKDTVIFANGNILQHGDVQACLDATGADAIMSAEGNLSDPSIFAAPPPLEQEGREYWRGLDGKGGYRVDAVVRRYIDILHRYVYEQAPPERRPLFVVGDDEAWLQESSDHEEEPPRKRAKRDSANSRATSPNIVAVRPHLFHLLRHFVSRHTDIRDMLARTTPSDMPGVEKVLDAVERRVAQGLIDYERTGGKSLEEEILPTKPKKAQGATDPPKDEENEKKEKEQEKEEEATPEQDPESSAATVKACKRPWWVVQPIVRPLPKEALAKGSIKMSKKEKKKQEQAAVAAATKEKTAASDTTIIQDADKNISGDQKLPQALQDELTTDKLVSG